VRLFGRTGHGGGIIKGKLLLSVLLLFGLVLVLNTSSAANVTADHTKPTITSVNPGNSSIISKSAPIKVTLSEQIKAGTQPIQLKNGKTVVSTKNSISGNTLNIIPTTPLETGVKYQLVLQSNSLKDLSGNGISGYSTSFTVAPLTLAQMKDGLKRAQNFYNTNNRLPNYVNFGTKKIVITEFQKIIATQGLKITTHKASAVSKSGTVVTSSTVTAYGWNSCSKGWFKTGGTFKNYCPFCHSYGTLVYNPKHTYEGEWTCTKCDSDFCLCGRCKASGSNVYLTPA
jgi:hypothetical protein